MAEQNRLVEAVEVTDSQVHLIHLKSVLDASTVDELEKALNYLLLQNNFKFIIDLMNVEFISSAGWGVFVGELKKIRDNQGDIKLACMRPEVYDTFLLLELDTLIDYYATLEESLAAFGEGTPRRFPASADESRPEPAGAYQDGTESDPFDDSNDDAQALNTYWPAEETGDDLDIESNLPPQDKSPQRDGFPAEQVQENGIANKVREKALVAGLRAPKPKPTKPFDIVEFADPWFGDETEETERFSPKPNEPSDGTSSQNNPSTESVGAKNTSVNSIPADKNEKSARAKQDGSTLWGMDSMFSPERTSLSRELGLKGLPATRPTAPESYGPQSAGENTAGATSQDRSLENMRGDALLEEIISVVIAYPTFGPSAIRQMLIDMNLEDESLSRSAIYKKLSEVNLQTRAKRIHFAQQHQM